MPLDTEIHHAMDGNGVGYIHRQCGVQTNKIRKRFGLKILTRNNTGKSDIGGAIIQYIIIIL